MTSNKPRIAVVGIPDKWSTVQLADRLEALTGFRLIVDMERVRLDIKTRILWYEGHNLCELDGLAIKKVSAVYSPVTLQRLDMLRVAESQGVRCFSNIASIHRLIDRLSCTIALRKAGLPMPETTVTERLEQAVDAVLQYGEAVLKPLFSTKARGMMVVNARESRDELVQRLARFQQKNPLMYIQKKHELSGEDYGIAFVGDTYLASYARVGDGTNWNTTIAGGGKYQSHNPSAAVLDLAQKARAVFNLDYTTVDIAITECGPVVFEVSAFGGFRGVKEGAGIDAAACYATHIVEQIHD